MGAATPHLQHAKQAFLCPPSPSISHLLSSSLTTSPPIWGMCIPPHTHQTHTQQTTLVKYILEAQHGHRIAVILNEFGQESGIESAFVQDDQVCWRVCGLCICTCCCCCCCCCGCVSGALCCFCGVQCQASSTSRCTQLGSVGQGVCGCVARSLCSSLLLPVCLHTRFPSFCVDVPTNAHTHTHVQQGGREAVPQWVELANGCLCCSVKAEFVQALEALLDADGGHSGKFDYVLVETTGVGWSVCDAWWWCVYVCLEAWA